MLHETSCLPPGELWKCDFGKTKKYISLLLFIQFLQFEL